MGGEVVVSMFNCAGQCRKTIRYKADPQKMNSHSLDLGELAAGIYFCHFKIGDSVVINKLVKR